MKLSNEIRSTFLNYFGRNGHEIVASSSLVPHGDKSILFTNAGMNQFKNAFLGLEKRSYVRAATAQKVMRVSGKHNDLENVGPSKRHHTFFEMLGNFSFGDYFKPDAMRFALELLEGEYGLERERMWFTIYKNDDEAEALWQKVGIKPSRILRFGEKDNFWSMGPTGPCGPNSEIHYFMGKGVDNDAKWVNNDDDLNETTVEIWNLVFMQFNRTEDGVLHPLPQTGVDTGMGFERLCRLLQGGENNYDSDLFTDIMLHTQALAGQTDAQRRDNYVPYRVIADHVRAASFLIGDGVLPGNVGRNYILRMIMRRAMRYGQKLGLNDPFLYKVSETVIAKMGDYYGDLRTRRDHILSTIHGEEERFARALDTGLTKLDEVIDGLKTKDQGLAIANPQSLVLPGPDAFRLYESYGLPLEITRDVARERGFEIDEAGYVAAREASKEVARKASSGKFVGNFDTARAYAETFETLKSTGKLPESGVTHNPYDALTVSTTVVGILRDGEATATAVVGEKVDVILAASPFYADSGGQVSDTGEIHSTAGTWQLKVIGVSKPVAGLIVHECEVLAGEPCVDDACNAQVEVLRRGHIARNHTATHLLQSALRSILGTHVQQQGSAVSPDRLRFDFSHPTGLTADELEAVGDMLNDSIYVNMPVSWGQENYKDAIASGAMAFFSDKYGDVVRVVRIGQIGEPSFSAELCGGTHVSRTGDIGGALIVSEGAVAAGIRRIEVVTGHGVVDLARKQTAQLAQVAQALRAPVDQTVEAVRKLSSQLSETQKALEKAQRELARAHFEAALANVMQVNGVNVLSARVSAENADLLREMSEWFGKKYASGVCVLGAVVADKAALVVGVSPDLNKRGLDAGKLIREIAAVVDGRGGGKPTLAQAAGKDVSKLDAALALTAGLVGKMTA
ncbi:MAG: alanine--tRNA ligase [Anaerolineae bacterium]|nr:alanine--tRNA ligase [Anaerolineae bacterium]